MMKLNKIWNSYTKVFFLSILSVWFSVYMTTFDINYIGWYVSIAFILSVIMIGYIIKGKWYILPIFYTLGILVLHIINNLYLYSIDGTFEEGVWEFRVILNIFYMAIPILILIGIGRLILNMKNKYINKPYK